MNCHDFVQRMQQRLDDRLPLDGDRPLQRHARECEHCQGHLAAWQQIASVIPPPAAVANKHRQTPAVIGLAAAVMLAFTLLWNTPGSDRAPIGEPVPVADDAALTMVAEQVDPAGWWRSNVQERDWVAQTMPAVRSLREGVAPLGRSLLQAVTILTIGGGDRPT